MTPLDRVKLWCDPEKKKILDEKEEAVRKLLRKEGETGEIALLKFRREEREFASSMNLSDSEVVQWMDEKLLEWQVCQMTIPGQISFLLKREILGQMTKDDEDKEHFRFFIGMDVAFFREKKEFLESFHDAYKFLCRDKKLNESQRKVFLQREKEMAQLLLQVKWQLKQPPHLTFGLADLRIRCHGWKFAGAQCQQQLKSVIKEGCAHLLRGKLLDKIRLMLREIFLNDLLQGFHLFDRLTSSWFLCGDAWGHDKKKIGKLESNYMEEEGDCFCGVSLNKQQQVQIWNQPMTQTDLDFLRHQGYSPRSFWDHVRPEIVRKLSRWNNRQTFSDLRKHCTLELAQQLSKTHLKEDGKPTQWVCITVIDPDQKKYYLSKRTQEEILAMWSFLEFPRDTSDGCHYFFSRALDGVRHLLTILPPLLKDNGEKNTVF